MGSEATSSDCWLCEPGVSKLWPSVTVGQQSSIFQCGG